MSDQPYIWGLLAIATLTALAGVFAGVFFSATPDRVRVAIPVSAGLLLGVALFGLLPELAHDLTWTVSLVIFAAGFLLLMLLDLVGLAICPHCDYLEHDRLGHEHASCVAPLHGFAAPVLVAAGLHALFDGWALAASSGSSAAGVKLALPLALVLHKLPEGLALGGILRPSLRSRWSAVGLALSAEMLTVAGGAISLWLSPKLGSGWTSYPLALAGGFFLFLAIHAFHGEWKKHRGTAVILGIAGLLFSAVLQSGLRSFFKL